MKYIKWFGIAVLLVVGISAAALGLKAALFPVTVAHTALNSAAGIMTKTLNSDNVLHNYEWFYDVNASIESRVGQIRTHSKLASPETDSNERSKLNMELAAMQQSCRDLVTKYNANSQKANRSLFKSNGLPESFSISSCEG